MEESYQEIWKLVEPLLFKAKRKDFLIHTKMVEKAMREIIAGEGGDTTFLIPAAILHDVGWSEVSEKLQLAKDEERKNKALQEHIQKAPKIIRELLTKVNYDKDKIERIVDIVVAHKFTEPKEKEKQIL